MGNKIAKTDLPALRNFFAIDRILDANCDYIKNTQHKNVLIGIVPGTPIDNKENPLQYQGIRIGEGEIFRLKNFVKNDNSLTYEFENDVKLNLFKREMVICYNLQADDLNVTKCIDPIITKNFKDIGMNSKELDEISKFYK